jgi:uncharacterized FlaG/YvyC family protein
VEIAKSVHEAADKGVKRTTPEPGESYKKYMKNKIGKPYEDIVKMSKIKNANIELLISDAYNRGYYDGIEDDRKAIIKLISPKGR